MPTVTSISAHRLTSRRKALGISTAALARRSGVSEPTVKRILGGQMGEASFANVAAIAHALGISIDLCELDADELCRRQARLKAEQIARLVQGTSALESQAVDRETYNRLVEKSYHELLAGSRRRLWSA
ncbi:MAG: helix-turn-helix domain-containing protein [Phycisphaerales bacterium]|nr:helix-turn-helix domain-containing protein [Planctomycetota bacterium]